MNLEIFLSKIEIIYQHLDINQIVFLCHVITFVLIFFFTITALINLELHEK